LRGGGQPEARNRRDLVRRHAGAKQSGHRNRSNHRDDRHHDEQFDEGEPSVRAHEDLPHGLSIGGASTYGSPNQVSSIDNCGVPLAVRGPLAGQPPFDVVCFGENSLDFAATGELRSLVSKQTLSDFSMQPGGQAATAAVGAARLGCRTRYVGVFGDDDFGRRVAGAFSAAGVDLVSIERTGVPSRIAVVLIDRQTGERRILEHRDRQLTLGTEEVPLSAICRGRVLMTDATDLRASIHAARAARAAGMDVVVDVDRVEDNVDELLTLATVVIVAEEFPASLTGMASLEEAIDHLHRRFHPLLTVVTRGAGGSLARADGGRLETPAFAVRAVDTTGAGDAFRAGFVAAWLRLPAGTPLDTLMQYANAAGALSCEATGAQAGLPDWAATEALVTSSGVHQSK